ncbi:MAG: phosphoribosyltransferase [Paludibacteraceae bacterium]|nr:phosphoribosyltransferase [Paludibacteraceae bacterium]
MPLRQNKYKILRWKRGKHRNHGNLESTVLSRLTDLFDYKGWVKDYSSEASCYMRFVKLLMNMTPKEQNFVIELTRQFLHIPSSNYVVKLEKPLGQLRKCRDGRLIFIGCMCEEDILNSGVKSCYEVLYKLRGTTLRYSGLDLRPYSVKNNALALTENDINEVNNNTATIVFVDDFIGTGDTAMDAVRYLAKSHPELVNWRRVCFLSIVAQSTGKKKLEDSNFEVYTSDIIAKGISDYYKGKRLNDAKTTMEYMESKMSGLKDEFKFGYKQSEALVCMERCPNNTFPIYWLGRNIAPYER